MNTDRREFVRVPLRVEVLLKGKGELVLSSSTLDLSLRGVRIDQVEQLSDGEECELSLVLGTGAEAARVEILGRVVRMSGETIGLEFLGVRGVESLDHLRRLVLYNAPDTSQVEEEFREHRGLKKRDE